MKLYLPAYPRGVHQITEFVTAESLGLDAAVFSTVEVKLSLDRHDPYLQLVFKFSVPVHRECDRCLAAYESVIDVDAPLICVLGSPARGEAIDDPDLVVVPATAVELDISQELRDFIVLALPGQSLCKPDCLGLCPRCGADLNREPCRCETCPS